MITFDMDDWEVRVKALEFAKTISPNDPTLLVADAKIIETYLRGEAT